MTTRKPSRSLPDEQYPCAGARGKGDVEYLQKIFDYILNNIDVDLMEYVLEEYQSNPEFEEGLMGHYRMAVERFESGDVEAYRGVVRFIFTYL